jgi:hypothetical protein
MDILTKCFTAAVFALSASAHAQTFNISAVNTQNYTINGELDPTLTLIRGQTYFFQFLNLASVHPFWIKTIASAGTLNGYSDGLSSDVIGGAVQGQSGNVLLTFLVPQTAPNTLFYNCQNHMAMTAPINIVDEIIFATGFE